MKQFRALKKPLTPMEVCLVLALALVSGSALAVDTPQPPPGGRQGITFHVSKLGNNSDGRSWSNAFHTIQAALQAIPDAQGGHRIVVRPDTYDEANLWPSHPWSTWGL